MVVILPHICHPWTRGRQIRRLGIALIKGNQELFGGIPLAIYNNLL